MAWATACRATRRPAKAANTSTETRSFGISRAACARPQRAHQPTISVDTKKKELVGDFKNVGRTWRPAKSPQRARVHDFLIKTPAGGKAIPYGVYDLPRNEGWVSVGIDHDTATFAVQSIRRWWQQMGRPAYRQAQSLLITADAGGSNGARLRLWKWELQHLANRTGLAITVCHFPPGTSKWNKIEHRLFSHIAMNWRGTPLVDLATIVSPYRGDREPRWVARADRNSTAGPTPAGIAVTPAQMATVRLERHRFHGDWNYTIHPATRKPDKSAGERYFSERERHAGRFPLNERPTGIGNRCDDYLREGTMRKWIAIWLASLAMVAGLTTVLTRAQDNTKIISGSDFGFRVDNTNTERTGKVVGTLVVRVNGN